MNKTKCPLELWKNKARYAHHACLNCYKRIKYGEWKYSYGRRYGKGQTTTHYHLCIRCGDKEKARKMQK